MHASVAHDKAWTKLGDRVKRELSLDKLLGAVDRIKDAESFDFESVIEQLAQLYERRVCIEVGRALQVEAKGGQVEAGKYAERLARLALGRAENYNDDPMEVHEAIMQAAEHGADVTSVRATGLEKTDELLRGIMPDELIILSGDPGSGKSSLAMQIMGWRARRGEGRKKQMFFTLEMPKKQAVQRMAIQLTGLPADVMTHGITARSEVKRQEALAKLSEEIVFIGENVSIVDRRAGRLSMDAMKAKILQKKEEHAANGDELDLVVIDYLQKLPGCNEAKVIEEWTAELAAWPVELEVPILCLSSQSRNNREFKLSRADKDIPFLAPSFSDLRGCASIEYDGAKVIFMLNRLENKLPVTREGYAEKVLYILKNRFGPMPSWVNLRFNYRSLTFEEIP